MTPVYPLPTLGTVAEEVRRHEGRLNAIEEERGELFGYLGRLESLHRVNHGLVVAEIQRLTAAVDELSVVARRPPLPSVHDEDLEVAEHTLNGQTPIYRISAPQLQAIKETSVRHELTIYAAGESARIKAAIARDREEERLARDAEQARWVKGQLGPKIGWAALAVVVTTAVAGMIATFRTYFHK
jgi:hypothetical protein